jgi:serine/threonine protein phosphatase PrpC
MAHLCFGASVTGPGHLRDGLQNQDAWAHARVAGGEVVVVADGLGSRLHAAVGARAACRAVPEAVRVWSRHEGASTDVLLGLVHLLWRARLGSVEPDTAATTCLFAFVRRDGSGLLAQLGDGLILLRERDQVEPLQTRAPEAFSNTTRALGVTRSVGAWATRPLDARERTLVLCTDGVSDDLLPDRYPELLRWLDTDFALRPPVSRRRGLADALRAWPTPNHLDDKTLALIRTQP